MAQITSPPRRGPQPGDAPAPTGEGYRAVRDLTEALAEPLGPEDQTVSTMTDVSPTKWHRAHTTWFFETFLLDPHHPGYVPHDPAYAYLFNSYYEALGARHPRAERGHLTRPTVADVTAYRSAVDRAMADLLADDPSPALAEVVTLGLHHEQQHQELLLMDIKHVLGTNPLRPAYRAAPLPPAVSTPVDWLDVDGGIVEIGHDGDGFAFDSEGPRHQTLLRPFRLADRLVTNGDWLAFMADRGYHRPDLWLSDGWATCVAQGWEAPLYWERADDDWLEYTLAGQHPVDPHRPVVHVSHYEADAYARWAGARLPTEAEWEVATVAHPAPARPYDLAAPHPDGRRDPVAGTAGQADGEVWQWTASAYLPYPGFTPAAGAVGEYNGKFMSGQMVLRGSSCATPTGHARPTYRNFFPPGSRWAFSGLRLATDQ